MAFSLIIAQLGITTSARQEPSTLSEGAMILPYVFDSTAVLAGLLITYVFAWLTDTQVVFRNLSAHPVPKKTDLKTLLTRMIPCCLLTAFGASCAGILVPLPGAVSVPLSFAIISFISSHLFGVRSRLWYSISVPVYLALAGTVLLSGPDLLHFFIPGGLVPGLFPACRLRIWFGRGSSRSLAFPDERSMISPGKGFGKDREQKPVWAHIREDL